jgi:hypothetical protein
VFHEVEKRKKKEGKMSTKYIDTNHTWRCISHGFQPVGQAEGEYKGSGSKGGGTYNTLPLTALTAHLPHLPLQKFPGNLALPDDVDLTYW